MTRRVGQPAWPCSRRSPTHWPRASPVNVGPRPWLRGPPLASVTILATSFVGDKSISDANVTILLHFGLFLILIFAEVCRQVIWAGLPIGDQRADWGPSVLIITPAVETVLQIYRGHREGGGEASRIPCDGCEVSNCTPLFAKIGKMRIVFLLCIVKKPDNARLYFMYIYHIN